MRSEAKRVFGMTKELLIHIFLILIAITMLFPFFWMFCTALKPPTEVLSWPPVILPKYPTLGNFIAVFTKWPFARFFFNSILITSVATFCILLTSSAAGYVFAKIKFFGRDLIFYIILATAIIPVQSYLIMLYLVIVKFHWINTYQGILAPLIIMSFGIFFLRQNIYAIPDELIDAARIDGASEFFIYSRIILPMTGSALAALGIYAFSVTWAQFIWPLVVVNTKEMYTTELGLAMFQKRFTVEYGAISAAAAVCVLPALIMFMVFRRGIVRGVTLTGMKG